MLLIIKQLFYIYRASSTCQTCFSTLQIICQELTKCE